MYVTAHNSFAFYTCHCTVAFTMEHNCSFPQAAAIHTTKDCRLIWLLVKVKEVSLCARGLYMYDVPVDSVVENKLITSWFRTHMMMGEECDKKEGKKASPVGKNPISWTLWCGHS